MKHPDDDKTIDMMDKTFSQLDSGIKGMEAESKRGRKPLPAVEPVTDVVDAEALVRAGSAATQVTLADQAVADSSTFFKMVGRIEMALFYETVSSKFIAEAYPLLREEFNKNKHLAFKDKDGQVKRVSSIEEACTVLLGTGLRRCQQHYANHSLLGPELFEKAESIGLRQRDYAAIKALPDDSQAAVKQAIESGDRAAVIDLVQEFAARTEAEKKKREDAELQLEASRKLVGDYAGQVTDLKEKLARPYKAKPGAIAQTEKEEAALKELNAVFTDAHAISLRLANVVNQVLDDYDDKPIADHARACIDHMARALAQLARTHGIDVRQTMNDELDMAAWTESMLGPDIAGKLKKSAG